jgi:hypothetical protein
MTSRSKIETLLAGAGVGWLLNDEQEATLARLEEEIDEFECWLRDTGYVGPAFPEIVERPEKYRAVVQTFAMPMTTPIRAVAFLVSHGAEIESLSFEYRQAEQVALTIVVKDREGSESVTAESDQVWDVQFLRHIGIMKMGDAPYLSGYYAFVSS